ncbi:MAG: DUF4446 family protein [Lachnospiraceae bacterium]|nr:DUF4446 family protein [Lachnospiraceae bacterium]
MTEIFNYLPFDKDYLILGMAILLIVLFIVSIVQMILTIKMRKRYKKFMKGKDGVSLEGSFLKAYDEIKALKHEDEENKESIKLINKHLYHSYQRTGIVKYNAFQGMGGKSSFALALLTQGKNGIVINSIHGREMSSVYIKEIRKGECDTALSPEETEALDIALGTKKE